MSDTVGPNDLRQKKPTEYDTPQSNPYTALHLSTIAERSGEGKGGKREQEYAAATAGEKTGHMDPVYAAPDEMNVFNNTAYSAPDEMNVFNNTAYGAAGSLSPQTEPNIYTTMDILQKNSDQVSAQTSWKADKKSFITYHRVFFCTIYTVTLFVSIGLASAALFMVALQNDTTRQSCNCMQNTETLNMLDTFQDQLDQTSRALERSQRETRVLAAAVAELSENTSVLLAPATTVARTVVPTVVPTVDPTVDTTAPPSTDATPPPSTNITRVPHNCTTKEEATCRITPGQRECQTPCVPEIQQGSLAINFQCIRLESEEPNPLIGLLDVTNGEAICLCYLVDINDNGPSTHTVDCVLRVTRCALVDLQG